MRARPDKLALDDGERRLTYGECLEAVTRLSLRLQALDLAEDETSVILLDTGIDSAIATMAHLRAGIVFVPVSPSMSDSRVRAQVRSCRPGAVVTERRYAGTIPRPVGSRRPLLVEQVDDVAVGDDRPPAIEREEVCRLLTSGSTGAPKQVIYTRKMILHDVCVRTESLKISPSDRFSQWISGTSLPLMTLFLSALNGASLHIRDIHGRGLRGLPDWIRENGVTILRLTPTLLRLLMSQGPRVEDLSSVRLVTTGGETLMRTDVELFRRIFPRKTVLVNHLSATEYRVACQYFLVADAKAEDPQVPVGFPVRDVEIEILDEGGEPLPDGEIGEIAIRSEFISPGYIDTGSGHTRKYPMTPHGFYRTGDLGSRRSDQCIEHHGRKDRMVKIRGVRVEIDEMEGILSKEQGVKDVTVLLDAPSGREPTLVACVVEEAGSSISLNRLRQAVYTQMGLLGVPHRLQKLDSLPMTSNGKVDRVELQLTLAAAPEEGVQRLR